MPDGHSKQQVTDYEPTPAPQANVLEKQMRRKTEDYRDQDCRRKTNKPIEWQTTPSTGAGCETNGACTGSCDRHAENSRETN